MSFRHSSIGSWPVRLYVLNDQGERELSPISTSHTVYLSEEHHFDVILGRSFMEKRQVRSDDTLPSYDTDGFDAGQNKSIGPDGCSVPGRQRNSRL